MHREKGGVNLIQCLLFCSFLIVSLAFSVKAFKASAGFDRHLKLIATLGTIEFSFLQNHQLYCSMVSKYLVQPLIVSIRLSS